MASRGPQMLKEFLAEESYSFSSKRAALTKSPIARFKAASAAIAAIHRASEIFFNRVKSAPLALPRSLSRKLSKPRKLDSVPTVVQVKDILRWKSFRSLVDEPAPLDLSCSTATTCTSNSSNSSTRSSGSSWCDGDFSEEPYHEFTTTDVLKESCHCEDEQLSPVSILNFPFQEEDYNTHKQHEGTEKINVKAETSFDVEYNVEYSFKWETEANKDACIRDMEAGGRWHNLDEEKEEIAVELEVEILNCLIDELFLLV